MSLLRTDCHEMPGSSLVSMFRGVLRVHCDDERPLCLPVNMLARGVVWDFLDGFPGALPQRRGAFTN